MSDRSVPAFQRRGDGGLRGQVIQTMIQNTAALDPDLWVVMDQRDNKLIEDELIHGTGSSAFVYSFNQDGKTVTGISVVGARELAAHYEGMKHTIISTTSKMGPLFVTQSFNPPTPPDVKIIDKLADLPDYYQIVCEVTDIKTGNSKWEVAKEFRMERRSRQALLDNPNLPEEYERKHYEKIADSKAWRNGVLHLIRQSVQLEWKALMLKAGKTEVITSSVIEEKRSGVLRYAAARAIGVDRHAIEALTMDQISGLADAVREGKAEQFVQAAEALGILVEGDDQQRPAARTIGPIPPREKPAAATTNGTGQQSTQKAEPQTGKAAAKKAPEQTKQDGPPPGHPAAGGSEQQQVDRSVEASRATETPRESAPDGGVTGAASTDQKVPPEDTKVAEEQAAGFDHYGLDENSDPVVDAAGFPKHFTDARDYALWYNDYIFRSQNPDAVRENNKDAHDEAALDPSAKVIMDAVDNPDGVADEAKAAGPGPVTVVPLETLPNGRPNWNKYALAVEASLKSVTTDEGLEAWIKAHAATYEGKSAGTVKIVPLVDKCRERLAEKRGDPDLEQAQGLVIRLEAVKLQHEYDEVVGNAAVRVWCKRMTTERPDIRAMVAAADTAAAERVKPKTARTISGSAPGEGNESYKPLPGGEPPPWEGEDPGGAR